MVEWPNNPQPGQRIIDVADAHRRYRFPGGGVCTVARSGGSRRIVACDINPDMLAEGARRAAEADERDISWALGLMRNICRSADWRWTPVRILFGIRNAAYVDAALAEMRRVLKPGGRFLCLEFSRVEAPGLDALDGLLIPLPSCRGSANQVAKDGEAYRYLAESIRRFPAQSRVRENDRARRPRARQGYAI